ncbi:putative Histidine kinase [Desulfamplus magnetovallimortis]|uniref:histidine kinase n=1 Tax=Desulfamplus magnetovallimortis TaxID=1246637 RepID=A0A1W1HH61_9BACT|nr:ATP-binding protein [Desulfamplus magnetovallimortis]SLM31814.1 putative Histidine kinase [Desulfamplus magnetovallimortis]
MGRSKNRAIPLWMPSAIVFVLLFVVVTAYFSWQIRSVKSSFFSHVQQHADMVSKIVRLNAAGTIDAKNSIEDVLRGLLENTARFVSYLDMIEPFSGDELSAFTRESGLAGIRITGVGYDGRKRDVNGPEGWLDNHFSSTSRTTDAGVPDETEARDVSGFETVVDADSEQVVEQNFNQVVEQDVAQVRQQGVAQVKQQGFVPLVESVLEPGLKHLESENLYILVWTAPQYPYYIILGIKDANISGITESLGLNTIIRTISTVPGIKYVKIASLEAESDGALPSRIESKEKAPFQEESEGKKPFSAEGEKIEPLTTEGSGRTENIISIDNNEESDNSGGNLFHENGYDIAQASQTIQGMTLTVGVDAGYLTRFINNLTVHFYVFGFFLIVAGTCLSFLLYRYQKATLEKVKVFERELSFQRENAVLGRSAAAIAHEIRNPLNALSMGLQRLKFENACSSEVHLKLIRQMSDAVKRANGSVSGLLNYARPRIPDIKTIVPEDIVNSILSLYQSECLKRNIVIDLDIKYHGTFESDGDMMGQIIENIVKNAVEAQPDKGFLYCSIMEISNISEKSLKKGLKLVFKNGNCKVPPENAQQIIEPYFTTRPDGTGLGMAIVKNMVKALDGYIDIQISEKREISIVMHFHGKKESIISDT